MYMYMCIYIYIYIYIYTHMGGLLAEPLFDLRASLRYGTALPVMHFSIVYHTMHGEVQCIVGQNSGLQQPHNVVATHA